jgi:hypothetical protein
MSASAPASRFRGDAGAIFALALSVRVAVVLWAAGRFPPTADGTYYQRIAERIGAGLGYTWLWPDGVVTYAAHYPVGYPGAVGAMYALVGPSPAAAMALNAVVGALAALAVHRLASRAAPASRWAAALAGVLVALHPGLVAYTPALMTEGVTASLVACAAWSAARARERRLSLAPFAVTGLILGAATLVRPQCLALAPLLAWLALAGPAAVGEQSAVAAGPGGAPASALSARVARFAAPIAVTIAASLLVCAPWTARNCVRMKRCALVSVNGGWNLLIGADPASTGAWSPVQVPAACRNVFDEAAKDLCFGREARRYIVEHPGAWLALAPLKLAATFDYCGAAGWYLHESNPVAFADADKVALGAVETAYERVVLLLALAWAARGPSASGGVRRRSLALVRLALFAAGVIAVLQVHAWLGHVALLALGLLDWRSLARGPLLASAALAVLAATALTHAVFFGSGRYGLVTFPLLSGLAALVAARRRPDGDSASAPTPAARGREDAGGAPPVGLAKVSDFDRSACAAAS